MGAKNKSSKETKWQCLINLIALLEHECRRKTGCASLHDGCSWSPRIFQMNESIHGDSKLEERRLISLDNPVRKFKK